MSRSALAGYVPVGEKPAGVVEEHHPVAEQAPALLRVDDHRVGGGPVGGCGRASRDVPTGVAPGHWLMVHRGSHGYQDRCCKDRSNRSPYVLRNSNRKLTK